MEQLDENALNIYTDGSSYGRPRRGGIAFRFVTTSDAGYEEVYEYEEPGYREATNNEMELMAAITALRVAVAHWFPLDVSRFKKVVIYTDSLYLKENYWSARTTWPQSGWATKAGAPVENVDLWKALVTAVLKVGKRVEFEWIKGKEGPHARAVDKLAKKSAQNPLRGPLTPRRVRRKTSPNQVDKGSVKMAGQQLSIRVIDEKWSSQHRLHRYRYEVISADSPFFEKVDFIWTSELLSAGHKYVVRVNDEPGNPRIVELVDEITDDH